jgi:flavodoxin
MAPSLAAVTRARALTAAPLLPQGKWLVRRGQRININLVALHRREDQWGGAFGDPNAFNPDRFLPGANEKAGMPPRHPQAFLPCEHLCCSGLAPRPGRRALRPWASWAKSERGRPPPDPSAPSPLPPRPLPGGFGVRACVGQLFALWEAKTFLAMLLPRFKLRVPPGYVPVASNREGGATPNPTHLAFIIDARPNAPPVPEGSVPGAAAPAKAPAGAAPPAAPAAGAAPPPGAHGTPLSVLFGSNSGMCEDFAQQLASKARAAGFAVTFSSLDSAVAVGPASLPASGAVAVVACTYNGFPPDNAAGFDKWLAAAAPGSQAGVKFAVFGVGNSQWAATFQAFPKRVDGGLAKAGAAAVVPLTTVDVDQTGAGEAFEEWADGLIGALLSTFQVGWGGGGG